jgi:hypothetical protein
MDSPIKSGNNGVAVRRLGDAQFILPVIPHKADRPQSGHLRFTSCGLTG